MKPKKFSQEQILKAAGAKLAALHLNISLATAETVPSGWFTAHDLAAASNKDTDHVARKLRNAGADRKRFRILFNGRVTSIYHYHLQ